MLLSFAAVVNRCNPIVVRSLATEVSKTEENRRNFAH